MLRCALPWKAADQSGGQVPAVASVPNEELA